MPLRVSNLRLGVDEPETELSNRLANLLGLRPEDLGRWRILRKSLDARDRDALQFVYAAEVTVPEDEDRIVAAARRAGRARARIDLHEELPFEMPRPGSKPLEYRPVLIGSGPGGLVAAYFLAKHGYQPIV